MEQTLLLIKPDATDKEYEIVSKLKQNGFKISQKRRVALTKEQATDFYQEKMDDVAFNDMVNSITSGPALALLVEKMDAYQDIAKLTGNETPALAKAENAESFRAKYGVSRAQNGVHYAASPKEAERQIQFFFPDHSAPTVPSAEYAKAYLEDSVYPTLLKGLTALSRAKPSNPTEWLGNWLLNSAPNCPIIEEPKE